MSNVYQDFDDEELESEQEGGDQSDDRAGTKHGPSLHALKHRQLLGTHSTPPRFARRLVWT